MEIGLWSSGSSKANKQREDGGNDRPRSEGPVFKEGSYSGKWLLLSLVVQDSNATGNHTLLSSINVLLASLKVAAIAAVCVQAEADYRPLMTDVVQSLIPLVKNFSFTSNSSRFHSQINSPVWLNLFNQLVPSHHKGVDFYPAPISSSWIIQYLEW